MILTFILKIFIFLSLVYSLFTAIFYIVLKLKNNKKNETQTNTSLPKVTVIVSAKNEENNISRTILSLFKQDYPIEKLEIIVVDDRSTDNTFNVLNSFKNTAFAYKVLRITQLAENLEGKQNAVHTAITKSTGELILTTDAGCLINNNWVQEFANEYLLGNNFIFSRTEVLPTKTLFHKLQDLDLRFLFSAAGALAIIKSPASAMGNNLGFSKNIYFELGGYPTLGKSRVEDMQLLAAFKKHKSKTSFLYVNSPLVSTLPEENLFGLIKQKARWAEGIKTADISLLLLVFLVYSLNFISSIFLMSAVFISPIWFLPIIVKEALEYLYMYKISEVFNSSFCKKSFALWRIYSIISPLILLITSIKKPNWK